MHAISSEAEITSLIRSSKIRKALKEKRITLGKMKDKEFKSLESDILMLKKITQRKMLPP